MLAQGAHEKGLDSRSRKDLYLKAVNDYSKCYRKMTGLKEIGMRLKMYYEGMVIAVEQCKLYHRYYTQGLETSKKLSNIACHPCCTRSLHKAPPTTMLPISFTNSLLFIYV